MKIDYNIIAIEVEKLYAKEFPIGTPEKEIAKYCDFISSFIEKCGWTIEEYTYRYICGDKNININ